MFWGSSGGGFLSTLGNALGITGGGFWAFGDAVAFPSGVDFGDSLCARKLHAQQSATTIKTNNFMVWEERRNLRSCPIGQRRRKCRSFRELQLIDFVIGKNIAGFKRKNLGVIYFQIRLHRDELRHPTFETSAFF
jgi:hypothetical protein